MDFDEDEDFFPQEGEEDEYDLMGFQGDESYQPHEDMLPPEEEMHLAQEGYSQQVWEPPPVAESIATPAKHMEDSATSPSRSTDASTPTSSSSAPSLPILGRRKRMREKAAPAGAWIGVGRAATSRPVSSQPLQIPGQWSHEALSLGTGGIVKRKGREKGTYGIISSGEMCIIRILAR